MNITPILWGEKNLTERSKSYENNLMLDQNATIKKTKKNVIEKRCNDIIKENWAKNCPLCNKRQFYSRGDVFNNAIKLQSVCLSCSLKGRSISKQTRMKLSKINTGIKRPQYIKDKISISMKGKPGRPHTEETKYKLRISTINYLKKRGILPSSRNYNKIACEYIDYFGKKNGYNFQHALNGGETELCGYFVDGYDKKRNIIFEYDEISHERRDRKQKDLEKTKNLINKIHPHLFFRYNEKDGVLYEIIEGKNCGN